MTQQGHIETQQHEQDFAYVDSLITGHTKPFVQMPSAQIEGGSVAKAARKQLESKTGKSAISSVKASDHLLPPTEDNED